MRKIILDLAVTLDGLIEGANGEVDWCIMDDGSVLSNYFDDFLASIDTIFYGRISYDLWGQYQPEENAESTIKNLYKSIHSKTKYVFSTTQKTDGDKVTFINSDIENRVREIKNQPGKNIWLYGGANLITTFIDLDLIDEYRLAVHPVILGKGKPLFANIRNKINLKLQQTKTSPSGVIQLYYEPATKR